MKLVEEIHRQINQARKEAQLASMERVTQLEDETHRWRKAYEELKAHHADERRADVRKLIQLEHQRDDARKFSEGLRKDLDQVRIERGHYRRMLEEQREKFRALILRQREKHDAEVCKLMNHIVFGEWKSRVVLVPKSEIMRKYLNTLPDDYSDWVRQGDIQRHAPSC